MQKTSVKEKKPIHFQNKTTHNVETLGGIHKKNAALLEISLLKNCGKLSSLTLKWHKKLRVYTKTVAPEKHRFAASKEA